MLACDPLDLSLYLPEHQTAIHSDIRTPVVSEFIVPGNHVLQDQHRLSRARFVKLDSASKQTNLNLPSYLPTRRP